MKPYMVILRNFYERSLEEVYKNHLIFRRLQKKIYENVNFKKQS